MTQVISLAKARQARQAKVTISYRVQQCQSSLDKLKQLIKEHDNSSLPKRK
jgi:hypothetical protein